MNLKVGLLNRQLLKTCSAHLLLLIGALGSIGTLCSEYISLLQKIGIVLAVVDYIYLLFSANRLKKINLKINGNNVIIKFGDLFTERNLKVINFNEYFDTEVDDVIISSTSLNGIFLNLRTTSIEDVDEVVSEQRTMENSAGHNEERERGKKDKFKLGTIIKYKDYLLVAFTKFDNHNRANLTMNEYFECMINFWVEVDKVYSGRNIALPLMGSGITRLKPNDSMSLQDKLEFILNTLSYSNIKLDYKATITIVLHESQSDDINLYYIGGKYNGL